MCNEKETVEKLEQEIRRLEHELEIAKLAKKVRKLQKEIDGQRGCPWEPWPLRPYPPWPNPRREPSPYPPRNPWNPAITTWWTQTSSAATYTGPTIIQVC